MKKKILVAVLVAIIAISGAASIALATGVVSISSSGSGSSPSLNKAQTGLVASDPLNAYESQQQLQSNDSYWSFGGTANSSSLYQFYESANQLHIGIAASSTGGVVRLLRGDTSHERKPGARDTHGIDRQGLRLL